MAVKYKRDPERTFDWNVKGRNPQATRRKTLYIYGGLGVAFVAAFAYHVLGQGVATAWLGPFETEATIVEKLVQFEGDPAARYLVRCAIDVSSIEEVEDIEAPLTISTLVRTDETSWRSVEVGTQVHAVCVISPELNEVRIRRLGLDTLIVDTTE